MKSYTFENSKSIEADNTTILFKQETRTKIMQAFYNFPASIYANAHIILQFYNSRLQDFFFLYIAETSYYQ